MHVLQNLVFMLLCLWFTVTGVACFSVYGLVHKSDVQVTGTWLCRTVKISGMSVCVRVFLIECACVCLVQCVCV